ncbi:hypothetical protein DPMN_130159 [Dreissena polymorpha]|uniref:Uncharacterized protein n=1 Tax=Dreissena polymorpha TaxID=45954 RepID=A0A9D4H4N4_DREPO|nr:hypothetical protein DPMN_130159 [Dreissena polymorpha]
MLGVDIFYLVIKSENRRGIGSFEFNYTRIPFCVQSDQIALHNAVRLGNATCVYLLLKHGASVNLQNKVGT